MTDELFTRMLDLTTRARDRHLTGWGRVEELGDGWQWMSFDVSLQASAKAGSLTLDLTDTSILYGPDGKAYLLNYVIDDPTVTKDKLVESLTANKEAKGKDTLAPTTSEELADALGISANKVKAQTVPILASDGEQMSLPSLLVLLAHHDAIEEGDTETARLIADVFGIEGDDYGDLSDGAKPPTLTRVKPETHYWATDKATRHITDIDAFDEGGILLDVGRPKGQTFIQLALQSGSSNIETSSPIDEYDRMIISAVATLKEAAKREASAPVISAYNICRTMGIQKPSTKQQRDIDQRMARLMDTTATIDFTDEAHKRNLTNPDTGLKFDRAVIRRHLIEAEVFDGTDEAGNRYVRYRLLADPPTYDHAKQIKQVAQWPQRLMELIPVRADGTEYRRISTPRQTLIKHAILERVDGLKRKKSNQSNTILYDGLCRTVSVDPKKRDAKKNVVDYAEGYLRALKNDGEITDFQPFTEGSSQRKVGVRVFVKRQ